MTSGNVSSQGNNLDEGPSFVTGLETYLKRTGIYCQWHGGDDIDSL